MLAPLQSSFESFTQLIFPKLCVGCGQSMTKYEQWLCLHCRSALPFANFINEQDNPVSRRFYGRVFLKDAFAFLIYNKSSVVQQLIHKLKYDRSPQIGTILGKILGHYLLEQPEPKHYDIIIPVPLHPKKEAKRGYNQAGVFGAAFAETIGAQYLKDALIRNVDTQTQTRKSRIERNQNVTEIFAANPEQLPAVKGKSIALVDDVVTTGATCEYCLLEIKKLMPKDMSVIAIASAL
jgi:ComF family protein